MSADELTLRPLLRRHPDARRANAPLLPPILLPYIALMFGSAVASLGAVYNALALRRPALAARSLLIGMAGWLAFFAILGNVRADLHVVVITGRVVHFLCGGLLYLIHRPHFTGSQFLGARALPLVQSYVAAFVLYLLIPAHVLAILLGVPRG